MCVCVCVCLFVCALTPTHRPVCCSTFVEALLRSAHSGGGYARVHECVRANMRDELHTQLTWGALTQLVSPQRAIINVTINKIDMISLFVFWWGAKAPSSLSHRCVTVTTTTVTTATTTTTTTTDIGE